MIGAGVDRRKVHIARSKRRRDAMETLPLLGMIAAPALLAGTVALHEIDDPLIAMIFGLLVGATTGSLLAGSDRHHRPAGR